MIEGATAFTRICCAASSAASERVSACTPPLLLMAASLVALRVREFDVQAFELFTVRRHDRVAGPVAQALWTKLG
jgi:hypothetical protein